MARLFVPKIYRIQHAIIKRTWETDRNNEGDFNWPTVEELVKITRQPRVKVLKAVGFLREKELIIYKQSSDLIQSKAKAEIVLLKEELLDEGWEKFKVNLLRWVQIVGIASGTIIGLATFVVNIVTTNKNKIELELLKQEVRAIKQSKRPYQHSLMRPAIGSYNRDSVKRK